MSTTALTSVLQEEHQQTLLARAVQCCACSFPSPALTAKALLPSLLLMCSDTRDAGRGCAFSTWHDRNASYSHKLAPTNSASDINCASGTELAEGGFIGKWQQGQQNFISEANPYFLLSLSRTLSKAKEFTQYERHSSFLPQNLRNVLHAAKLQVSRNGGRSLCFCGDPGTDNIWLLKRHLLTCNV